MWMVDPKLMCRKHLLGQHVELHMIIGSINKNKSLKGFIDNALIEPQSIVDYHEEVINEMLSRGYKHNSPLPEFELTNELFGFCDLHMNYIELLNRCPECSKISNML